MPLNLKLLGQERLVDEQLRRPKNNRRAVLAGVSIGSKPVTTAPSGEKAPVPLIDELEVGFYRLFDLLRGSKCLSDPLDCRCRGVTLSLRWWLPQTARKAYAASGGVLLLPWSWILSSPRWPKSQWTNKVRKSLPAHASCAPAADLRSRTQFRLSERIWQSAKAAPFGAFQYVLTRQLFLKTAAFCHLFFEQTVTQHLPLVRCAG